MNFKNLYNKYRYRRLAYILATTLMLAMPLLAHAEGFDALSQALKSGGTEAFKFFDIILQAMQVFLWPVLLMIGGLLNNDLLFSGGMQTVLLNIWSAVRDFVNIMFVLGLLAVAIYNIVGVGGSDDFSIKAVLPKVAIGLIAVNFSFMLCKVVLDTVNITTTAIFAVPMASDSLKKYATPEGAKKLDDTLCKKILVKNQSHENPFCSKASDPAKTDTKSSGAPAAGAGQSGQADQSKSPTVALKNGAQSFFSTFNSRNVALVLALELMDIGKIDTLNPTHVTGLDSLAINTIFSVIFLTIYSTSFIALFVVLLARVVVLWISIAISPLSFLGIAFKKVKDTLSDNDPFFGLFMSHALVPVKVSIVLTIGMIMIAQLKQISPGVQLSTNPADLGAITSGMSTIQDLMAGLATAAFIWMAVFEAMKGTKAQGAVDAIKGAVGGFGTSLAKMPLYAPILPVDGGGKKGLASLASSLNLPAQKIAEWQEKDRLDPKKEIVNKLQKAASGNDLKAAQEAIAEASSGSHATNKEVQSAIADTLNRFKSDVRNIPSKYNNDLKKFTDDLKAGNVAKEVLEKFVADNQMKISPAGATEALKEAQDVAHKASTSPNASNTILRDATKDLGAKIQALEKAKDSGDNSATTTAIKDVKEATTKVEKITAVLGDLKVADIVKPDGKINDSIKAGKLKQSYDALPTDADKKPVREHLIQEFKKNLKKANDAEALVDNILKDGSSATGLTPTPASPTTSP